MDLQYGVWSKAIPSNNVFHPSAGSDLFHYGFNREFYHYASVVSVGCVFAPAITCVLRVAVSVGLVTVLYDIGGKHHSLYGNGVANSVLIHCDHVRRCGYYFKRSQSFASIFFTSLFAMFADLFICAGGLSANTC